MDYRSWSCDLLLITGARTPPGPFKRRRGASSPAAGGWTTRLLPEYFWDYVICSRDPIRRDNRLVLVRVETVADTAPDGLLEKVIHTQGHISVRSGRSGAAHVFFFKPPESKIFRLLTPHVFPSSLCGYILTNALQSSCTFSTDSACDTFNGVTGI